MVLLARVLLLVQGLMCVIYGLVVAFNLEGLASYMGLTIASADGKAELLTMYLGLSGSVGAFMVYAAATSKWVYEALLFMLISMAGITLARLGGFVAFDTGEYILSSLLYDVPVLVLTVFTYYRLYIIKR